MTRTAWPHFSAAELACRCQRDTCPVHGMDPRFMRRLETLREVLAIPLRLNSAFRCPEHNTAVSTTGRTGPHTTGRAVDIRLSGEDVVDLMELGIELGFTGFGFMQDGATARRFVHLDDLEGPAFPRPRIWTY